MSASHIIRVMLVDDHAMVRRGLAIFLSVFDDLLLAGEADSGEAAVEMCGIVQPDVILMDLMMPDMDGITATRQIRQRFPKVQVVALTSFKEEQMVQNALQAGAIGYLLKDVLADDLAKAIRAAYSGRATLAPEAVNALVLAATQPPTPGQDLTKRERQVLALLVEGLTNTQIAGKLSIRPSTVKSHVSHILLKLSADSRTQAATIATRQQLLN